MYNKLSAAYRVVCSYNPEKPEDLFVDICRDGFCSHDMIFEMQKKRYNDKNLQRLCNDSRGIMLREARDGSIRLIYTQHKDQHARERQEKIRERIDPEIIRVFNKMRVNGKFQTISEPLHEYYNRVLSDSCELKEKIENPQEEKAVAENARRERLERLKEIRHQYYATREFADKPYLRLAQMQAERSGD